MRKHLSLISILLLTWFHASAGGPNQVAKINRALWPYAVNSEGEFDFASKMEMLAFISTLNRMEKQVTEDSLKKYLGMEKVSVTSVQLWQNQTKNIFLSNFKALSNHLPHDYIRIESSFTWQSLVIAADTQESKLPPDLKQWYTEAKNFYSRYLYEQIRLAALFPRITSEILTLHESEITGSETEDKKFLLTFDDGPTAPNGHTDVLINTLGKNQTTGIFFILGDMYQARMKATSVKQLHDLYGKNVVGSHGKVHKSHQKYDDWEGSLYSSFHLIDSVVPENKQTKYFRPPYGQRNMKIISYLNDRNSKVMLWNIDSQDWNNKIASKEVADRVITLMLLWRKGILLFHDIHPKANAALPVIWKYFEGSGIQWKDPAKL